MPTASDYTVNEWKIGPANAATYKLRETIDPKGRVVELRFLKNGSTYENPLCYLPNKITYRYSKKRSQRRYMSMMLPVCQCVRNVAQIGLSH
jgi:hypothetical protein